MSDRETGKPDIDWKRFKDFSKPTIECVCGAIYTSHCKFTFVDGQFVGVTEGPCPACGKEFGHVIRASHPPETWEI